MFRYIYNCLCCDSNNLYRYFNLKQQPLANNLKNTIQEKDNLYPLVVAVCRKCFHSQLTISVDKELLFKNYLYVSGTSKSLCKYFEILAKKIVKETGFGKGTKILDIACNDGTFLQLFDKYRWDTYGIDPAENLRLMAVKKGIKMYTNFFPEFITFGTRFKVITALNVLAHTDTPYEFLVGCEKIIEKDGYIFIQTSQKDMVVNGEFDTIYHEHQSFFTIKSMLVLVRRAGLCLERVETMDVHGSSYLFTIRKQGTEFTELENDGRYSIETYYNFRKKAKETKTDILRLIETLGLPVVGYGAAAKGVVLLNYLQLPLEYVIDDNPLKQGKVIGGINTPIYPIDKLKEDKRDLTIIILPWNMCGDITDNIRKVRRNSADKFIKPFPSVEVL